MRNYLLRLFFGFYILLASSCVHENGIEVVVKNMSDNIITDIEVFTIDKKDICKFKEIKSKEMKKEFLDMQNTESSDGSYQINYLNEKGIHYYTSGGYYTNGSALERKITFTIKNDTILVKSSFF